MILSGFQKCFGDCCFIVSQCFCAAAAKSLNQHCHVEVRICSAVCKRNIDVSVACLARRNEGSADCSRHEIPCFLLVVVVTTMTLLVFHSRGLGSCAFQRKWHSCIPKAKFAFLGLHLGIIWRWDTYVEGFRDEGTLLVFFLLLSRLECGDGAWRSVFSKSCSVTALGLVKLGCSTSESGLLSSHDKLGFGLNIYCLLSFSHS